MWHIHVSKSYAIIILGILKKNVELAISISVFGSPDTGKKASTLVAHGTTHTLFQVLVYESRDSSTSEELLLSIHQILAKLGPKGMFSETILLIVKCR